MGFESFMGSVPDDFRDDGFITIQETTPEPVKRNPHMRNFGNTEMAEFKKDESALNLVNSTPTRAAFGIGSAPSPIGTTPKPTKGILGAINWRRSSETLMVGGAFFVSGFMVKVLFDRYVK